MAQPLVLERTIPLKSVFGRIDHIAVDLARKRLFVAELGNGSVDTIDLAGDASGTVTHRISGLQEPQGIPKTTQTPISLLSPAPATALSRPLSG